MSYLKKREIFEFWDTLDAETDKVTSACWQFDRHRSRDVARFRRLLDEWDRGPTQDATVVESENAAPVIGGVIEAPEDTRQWAKGKTFVFTSAQSNTLLNERFWAALMMLVEDRDAELHISRVTYNKGTYGKKSVKPGSTKASDTDDLWFDPRIEPYVSDESVQIASDLIWCGELNIGPTKVDPIVGFENHGRGASVILPHAKMALRSVPTMKCDPARFAYTTGTVTARNYIEKAAGQKASLHHVYGALLVEVDENGVWWARQINADNSGTIYDLTNMYQVLDNGTKILDRNVRAEIVTHGDLHGNKVDGSVLRTMSGVVDKLKPRNQVFHDTVDFQPRNHHNIKDPHFLHEMHVKGLDSVSDEFNWVAELIGQYLARPGTKHWIITSNHDQAIEGWLRNTAGFHDPVNQDFWLQLNCYCAEQRKTGRKSRPFAYIMGRVLPEQYHWEVVDEDESLMIAGIENGLHGHLGPNGARGTPKNLRYAGKSNTGHTHSAGIVEGVYTAGVFGNLDMGYNKGLSSWSHSFIITYPNGKRTICTIKNGKAWR